jgi:hypothetical protein
MAAVRICFLVAVSSSSVIAACAGESSDSERDAGEHVGGATTGGAAAGAQPDTGGTSGTGGAGTGGNRAESGTSGVGGAGAGMGGMPGGNGGSGGGVNASCNDVMPCGGDVVGTWTVIDSCLKVSGAVDLTDFGLGCTAAPTSGSLEVIGTWSASSEGMMVSDNTTTTGDATIDVPEECAVTSSQPIACVSLAGPIAPFRGYASLVCVDSESAWCACSGTFEQAGGMGLISQSPMANGTYTTADGVLTVLDGMNQTEYSYCSSENTMIVSLKSVGKTGTVTGTIVLQKQ